VKAAPPDANDPAFALQRVGSDLSTCCHPRPILERLESLQRRFIGLVADMPRPDQIDTEPLRRVDSIRY